MSIGCFMMLAAFMPVEAYRFTVDQVIALFVGGMAVVGFGTWGMTRNF